MAKSLSITIHPSDIGAEYLSVSDALHHVLDLVEVLEKSESDESGSRRIVWRLTDAHTNSPPLTLVLEPYPVDPTVSIAMEANRVVSSFADGLRRLLDGYDTPWLDKGIAQTLKRALKRNMNGIGRTEIIVDDDALNVMPANAKTALLVVEKSLLDEEGAVDNKQHTEFGAIEVEIEGIARWNNHPALTVVDRLSGAKVTCVLNDELAGRLGPSHLWKEVWTGNRLLVTGALYYGPDGALKRIHAEDAEDLPWADVTLAQLADIDILQGRTVSEHLHLLRGRDRG